MNSREAIEVFHLLFIRHLEMKVDKSLYCLKGGCNLRFYFKSIRYSEDIDFDVHTVAVETLRKNVSNLLKSRSFQDTLGTKGLMIENSREAKQSETTQRWKIHLRIDGQALPVPTKIEFSRRTFDEDREMKTIDPELLRTYNLYPIVSNHYGGASAIRQKLNALIHRTETQSRDIFDLDWLARQGSPWPQRNEFSQEDLDRAIENAMSIRAADFTSQVVAYLLPHYQQDYRSPSAWAELQSRVVQSLEALR